MRKRPMNPASVSRLLLIASLLLFTALLHAEEAASDEARVAAAIRAGDYSHALQLLAPALQQFPEDAQLWTMQGVAYDREGNKKEALASFAHALKIAPDAIPALQGAAQIHFNAGSPRAIPFLQHLLRLRPNDETSHGMLAILEFQQNDCSAAIPHFEKAAAVFESRVDGLHAYAVCLVKEKQIAKAADVLEQAARLNPDDKHERQLLASLQLMAARPEAALASLKPLLASEKPDPRTLELASSAYEGVHDTERAVAALQQAIVLDPKDTGLYLEFANMAAQHQSFQVGINVINDGLAMQPQSAPLYFARGMLLAQMADYEKAQADFETAYRLDPNQSLSSAAQGLMAVQQNDLEGALKNVEEKLARKPNDPILLYLKADVLTQQGLDASSPQFRTALQSAKESIRLRPDLAPGHAVLAKLYLQSGDDQHAIAECRKALKLNPKDQTSVYRLIQALRKTGEKNEIPELLKRLAQLRQESTRDERERYRYKLVEGASSNP